MIAYSAADAISPAIERTRSFLFRPFRFWTFLKLCLVAVLTDGGGGGSFNSNFPSGTRDHSHSFFAGHSLSGLPDSAVALGIFVIIPAILLGLALSLWIWYLLVRLRFAYFHCLVYQTRRIRDGWRPYGEPAMRMFLLQLVVGLVFLAGIALIAVPFFFLFSGLSHAGQGSVVAAVLLAIAIGIPLIIAIVFFGIAYEIITHDFMLPRMALENATVGEAWRASRADYRAEKGAFWLYGLLRVLLAMVAGVIVAVVLLIPILILVLLFVVGFSALHDSLANSVGAGNLAAAAIAVLAGTLAAALVVLLSLVIGGPIATWKRQYALLFYGGRYESLGNLISPPPPPPPAPVEAPTLA
jgi:hypothetical protein